MLLVVLTTEQILLYGSMLAIIGLFLSKKGFEYGLPTLLLFLGVGVLASTTNLIQFNNPIVAQAIGVIALTVILFSGGMGTSYKEVKPVMLPGALLATVGVLLTSLLTGTFIYYLFQWFDGPVHLTYLESLLFASVMSSTDSASVFSILRSNKTYLKHNLKPLLEFESGSNDPMAYMLTIILVQMIQSDGAASIWDAIWMFVVQFSLGVIFGLALGWLAVKMVNKFHLQATALYPILMLSIAFFIYAVTYEAGGNGYLAVYLAGMMVGNMKMVYYKTILRFFDGIQSLCQLIMFLSLGLMVDFFRLSQVAIPAILISLFLILLGRPVAVFLTMLPFWKKFKARAQLYVGWVGLRGAVPIIFATVPWVAGIESAELIFTVVFFITMLSLIIQGTTVQYMAKKLNLIDHSVRDHVFQEMNLPEQIKSTLSEMIVSKRMIGVSNKLKDIDMPNHTLAILVQRDGDFFIPNGETELRVNDHILFISDDDEALVRVYEELGIVEYKMVRNV